MTYVHFHSVSAESCLIADEGHSPVVPALSSSSIHEPPRPLTTLMEESMAMDPTHSTPTPILPSSPSAPVPFPSTSNAISLASTFKDILHSAVRICEHQARESLSTYSFNSELRECDALDDLAHIFWTYTEPLVILSQKRDHSFINQMVILLHFFYF